MFIIYRTFCVANKSRCPPAMWLINSQSKITTIDDVDDADDGEDYFNNNKTLTTTVIIFYNNYLKLRGSSMNNRVPVVLWITEKKNFKLTVLHIIEISLFCIMYILLLFTCLKIMNYKSNILM